MDTASLTRELQALVAEHKGRPYGFFTILGDSENPDEDLSAQNEAWSYIKKETWHSLDLANYFLWGISDNGDLLWWNGEQTIAMNPRDSVLVSEPVAPRQFIRLVGMGKIGRIFPSAIEVSKI